MRTTTLTDAKDTLGFLIDQVRAGGTVMILDGGRPVARLVPVGTFHGSTVRSAWPERAGVIRLGSAAPLLEMLRSPAPPVTAGASGVQAVLDERRSRR